MASRFVHTCVRVRDIAASQRFYRALGFEPRGRLNLQTAYNVYLGLPDGGDVLELTERGHSFRSVLEAMAAWGDADSARDPAPLPARGTADG